MSLLVERSAMAWSLRLAWLLVLLAHVVLAALVFWFLPHGFPVFHPRFVLATLAPLCIVTGSLALATALVFAPRVGARFVPAIPAFWGSAALALLLVFPATGEVAAQPIALVAIFLALLAGLTCQNHALREWLPAALVGAASGQFVARCERPAPASTRPSPQGPPRRAEGSGQGPSERLEIKPDLVVEGSPPSVTWQGQGVSVFIAPGLEFTRPSPDGFWSVFSRRARVAPSAAFATTSADALRMWSSDGTQLLRVQRDEGRVSLEAWTVLDTAVYSHLNSFTTVQVSGHRRLGLRFSACPSQLIAVTHADYPTGAPARFAYVDAARKLRVVQATDAEKGPFVTLAEGLLGVDGALAVELVELGEPARTFGRLEFLDFAAQLSSALSPTAGYGVAENAIEFGLAEAEPSSPAHLVLTLAATGVGRGWDSVGHRAGAYRNRVRMQLNP